MFYTAELFLAAEVDLATNSDKNKNKNKTNKEPRYTMKRSGKGKQIQEDIHLPRPLLLDKLPKLTAWDQSQVSAARSETAQAGKSPRGTAENKPDGSGLGLTTGE